MERHKRGSLVMTRPAPWPLGLACAWPWRRGLRLAGAELSPADETRHFKFVGTTGSGKSTAIAQLLQGALQRGEIGRAHV